MQDSRRFVVLCCLGVLAWRGAAVNAAQLKGTSLLEKVKQCPNEGAPVCGANGTDLMLFPNDCILDETNNEMYLGKPGFQRVALGFCLKHCNLICSTSYEPICALDVTHMTKRTFFNRCEMTRDACLTNVGWLHFEDGECSALQLENLVPESPHVKFPKRNTTVPCSLVFNPVCAILSGVKSTFDNECLVKAENARTGTNWKIFSQGYCAEDARRYKNSAKNKTVTARSTNPVKPDDYDANPEKTLGPDVTYIYTPPVFQTQFIRNNPTNYEQPIQKHIKEAPRVPSKSSPNEGFYRALNMPPVGQFGHFNPFMSPGIPLNYQSNTFKTMPPYLPLGARVPRPIPVTAPKQIAIPKTIPTKPNPILSPMNAPVSNALPVFRQDSLTMPKQIPTSKMRPVKPTILSSPTGINAYVPAGNLVNHKIPSISSITVQSTIPTTTTTTTTVKPQTVNGTSPKIMTPFAMVEPYMRHPGYHHTQPFPPLIPDVQEFDGKLKECKYGPLPVCGTLDGKMRTFNNFCELLLRSALLKQAWTILHDGKCYSCTNLDECTQEYRPICVSRNGVNYTMSNECFLSAGMCQDQRSSWKILSRGECVSPYKTGVEDKLESSTPGFRYTNLYREHARPQAELFKATQNKFNSDNNNIKNHNAPSQKLKSKIIKSTVRVTTSAPIYKSTEKPFSITESSSSPSIPKEAIIPTTTRTTASSSTSTTATTTASTSTTTEPTTTSTSTTTTTTTSKPTTERVSVYGYGKNSYIMRLVRKKGLKLKL